MGTAISFEQDDDDDIDNDEPQQQPPLLTRVKEIHTLFYDKTYSDSDIDREIKKITAGVRAHFYAKGVRSVRQLTTNVKDVITYIIKEIRKDSKYGTNDFDTLAVLFDRKNPCNCICSTMLVLLICEQLRLVPDVVTAAYNSSHIWVILKTQTPRQRIMFETTAKPGATCVNPMYDGGFFNVMQGVREIGDVYLYNMYSMLVTQGLKKENPAQFKKIEASLQTLYTPGSKKFIDTPLIFKQMMMTMTSDENLKVEYAKDAVNHITDRSRMNDEDLFNNRTRIIRPLLTLYLQKKEFRKLYNHINETRPERVLPIQIEGIANPFEKTVTKRQSGRRRNASRDILQKLLKEESQVKAIIAQYAACMGLDPPVSLLLRSSLPRDVMTPPLLRRNKILGKQPSIILTRNFLTRRRELIRKNENRVPDKAAINVLFLGARVIK